MNLENFELFGLQHLGYLAIWILFWTGLPYLGVRVFDQRARLCTVWLLALVTIAQEILDYGLRFEARSPDPALDLPLHYCHLAQIWSVILLFCRQSLLFELTYFWGLAGALQAMLTPDLNAFDSGLTLFLFFAHHGLIILIISWLVFVQGYRCRPWAVIRVLLMTNLIMLPVYYVDRSTGANYMYLVAPPHTDSPFISGGWPGYIFRMEAVALVMMSLLQLPMLLARSRESR